MTEKNEQFPNALEAFLIVMALYMAEFLMGGIAYDVQGTGRVLTDDVSTIIVFLGNAVIFIGVMQYKSLTYRELLHSSPSSMGAMSMVLLPAIALTIPLAFLVMYAVGDVLLWLFPLTGSQEAMFARMDSGSLAMVVDVCILAPVLEEMLFRGIILRSFLRQYSKWAAILGSATLFGVFHLNIYQCVAGLLIGLYLGWLYERTKSLLPCIGLHVIYNTMYMFTPAAAIEGSADSASYWALALLLGAAGALMLRHALIGQANKRQPN